MKTFKLTLEYDGTDFNGWQVQANAPRTVQGEIQKVLFKIFRKHVVLIGSGRTDAGVHARGQVAHFRVATAMPTDEIQRAMNYNLPLDVVVLRVEEAENSFHAQRDACWKTYSYTILNRSYASALERRYCCFFPRRMDLRLMRAEAAQLLGTKDFRSFANIDRARPGCNAVRTVRQLDIRKQGDFLVLTVESNGFLYKMVRNIVGTLIEVASGRFPPGSVEAMLKRKDRRAAGVAAQPQGLCLEKVDYADRNAGGP